MLLGPLRDTTLRQFDINFFDGLIITCGFVAITSWNIIVVTGRVIVVVFGI